DFRTRASLLARATRTSGAALHLGKGWQTRSRARRGPGGSALYRKTNLHRRPHARLSLAHRLARSADRHVSARSAFRATHTRSKIAPRAALVVAVIASAI